MNTHTSLFLAACQAAAPRPLPRPAESQHLQDVRAMLDARGRADPVPRRQFDERRPRRP